METEIIRQKYLFLCRILKSEMNRDGYWTGYLSSSALSTAVAIVALKQKGSDCDKTRIEAGFRWLCRNFNPDGGYGDTTNSISNVSTTLLCYAALNYCQANGNGAVILDRIKKWLSGKGIILNPDTVVRTILDFYGKDYTFSVPILSMLTICNVIRPENIYKIPTLPFELTLLPQKVYRFVNLRVVSYALPALIGVGVFLHLMRNNKTGILWNLRKFFIKPAIRKLDKIVPDSGGFLEAIPLTGFVVMCLVAVGEFNNKAVIKGVEFLRRQQRNDGSWPIDTDLSTWVTTLSIKAFGNDLKNQLNAEQISVLKKHLLTLQYKNKHPFNGANPGGWGWTSYSGSVPDADDTSGAILALLQMHTGTEEENNAILGGCQWLIDLQNADGGFPTFCKGWGRLPFDRSCADITGHALLALVKAKTILDGLIPDTLKFKIDKAIKGAINYLKKNQSADGSWLPLWFGNQHTGNKSNPVYGTSRICVYLTDCLNHIRADEVIRSTLIEMSRKAQQYLINSQNSDGSWGGDKGVPGTIEETSLAVSAIATINREISLKGITWLEKQDTDNASPIGLYFALLWYYEKTYPLIFMTEALRRTLYEQTYC